MTQGILYGIGVGPGDPELLTIKAIRHIKESNIIILPAATKEDCHAWQIAVQAYPDIEQKEVLCLPFPMTRKQEVLKAAHEQIYERIAALLEAGKTAAFLTIGDPSVYSTYNYIHRRVLQNGGCAVMVSGVPSFCAAAGTLGISLADNKEEIHIIPGSYDIAETLQLSGTKVYMKSGRKLAELKDALKEAAGEHSFEVFCVENCGMAQEKKTTGMENLNPDAGYLTIVIVKETEKGYK